MTPATACRCARFCPRPHDQRRRCHYSERPCRAVTRSPHPPRGSAVQSAPLVAAGQLAKAEGTLADTARLSSLTSGPAGSDWPARRVPWLGLSWRTSCRCWGDRVLSLRLDDRYGRYRTAKRSVAWLLAVLSARCSLLIDRLTAISRRAKSRQRPGSTRADVNQTDVTSAARAKRAYPRPNMPADRAKTTGGWPVLEPPAPCGRRRPDRRDSRQ